MSSYTTKRYIMTLPLVVLVFIVGIVAIGMEAVAHAVEVGAGRARAICSATIDWLQGYGPLERPGSSRFSA
jgi:hypothetical protein